MPPQAFERRSAAVLELLVAGVSIADAARRSGVGARTVKRWLERGRQDPAGKYGPFAQAIDAAKAARALPAPEALAAMDEDELAVVVSEAARRGNVQAMKLRWEQLRAPAREETPVVSEAQKVMDELAVRRRQHGRDG